MASVNLSLLDEDVVRRNAMDYLNDVVTGRVSDLDDDDSQHRMNVAMFLIDNLRPGDDVCGVEDDIALTTILYRHGEN